LFDDKYEVLQGADALVICTEWQQFRVPDLVEMEKRMRNKVIVDGRNLYSPQKLSLSGWKYMTIGRDPIQVN
jgi:UDPglucose 6-dehydrogenase